jgi:SAM-dependent methyltransferase
MDAIEQFKQNQKASWSSFAPLEVLTCVSAARLAVFAQVKPGNRVLDVGCGTGVVSLCAARMGAKVTGLDLTPELLVRARENSALTGAEIDWHEGDAESLPFPDGTFDVVVSQYGHMFAPRPEVAIKEMLRVLKPGGTIAFGTWPPEVFIGKMFQLTAKYLPPPQGIASPVQWGSPEIVRERLGSAVTDLVFDRGTLASPYVSVQHVRGLMEHGSGPVKRIVAMLEKEPAKLATFRSELDGLASIYFDANNNVLRQDYLHTRAKKI